MPLEHRGDPEQDCPDDSQAVCSVESRGEKKCYRQSLESGNNIFIKLNILRGRYFEVMLGISTLVKVR